MRSVIITAVALAAAAILIATPGPILRGDEPKADSQSELKNLQGLWMHIPGGMEHLDGGQVVRGPDRDGPCFFIRGWISHRAWNRRNTEQAIIDAMRRVNGPVGVERVGNLDVMMLKGRKADVEATQEAFGKIEAAAEQ